MELILCILAILAPVLVQGSNCKQGWIADTATGTCYKVVQKNMNWYYADRECARMFPNSRLAVIKTSHDNEFVKGLLKNANGFTAYWIGATDRVKEGVLVWGDGSQMAFKDWHKIEPNNQGNEDCVLYHRNRYWFGIDEFKWNDVPCHYVRSYGAVCQMPEDRVKCEPGWIADQTTGICYKILQKNMDWWTAQKDCLALNKDAKLAEMKSKEENDFIKSMLKKTNGFYGYWMGLTDVKEERKWIWTDGSPYWHSIEPNNQGGNEDCALFHSAWWWGTSDYKWNDVPCDYNKSKFGAVCQMPGTPINCRCGQANRATRIVGGTTTEINEYPWQVGLASGSGKMPYCGGSIVSSKTIVTAAHCTNITSASNIWVVVAEHDLTKPDGERYVKVCGKAEHPNFNSRTADYDYATLTLCEELSWAKDVAPVCMPTTSGQGSQYENKASVVSGWGTLSSNSPNRPAQLQEVTVNTMSNSACCASSNLQSLYSCIQITSRMICASAPNKDACMGDSGGPLVVSENNSYKLAGIVSWGFGCAQANAPGVYARVTDQLGWLNSNIQGSTCLP